MALRFASVIFDCDSTLAAIEGIDELGAAHRSAVAELTDAAMRGEVPLEAIYGRRLSLIRPTRRDVEALARRYLEALIPDARKTVAALQSAGISVYVVSGGLAPAITAVARALGVPASNVAAVGVHFEADGAYAGYDEDSPLARHDGKRTLIEGWDPPIPRPSLLVGDGATDLAARPAVDCFAAYAGVVRREPVAAAADFVIEGATLAPVLALALGAEPPPSMPHSSIPPHREP